MPVIAVIPAITTDKLLTLTMDGILSFSQSAVTMVDLKHSMKEITFIVDSDYNLINHFRMYSPINQSINLFIVAFIRFILSYGINMHSKLKYVRYSRHIDYNMRRASC